MISQEKTMANTIRLGYTLLRKKAMINQSRINGQQHSMTTNLTENAKLVDYVTLRLEDELTSGEYPNVRLSTVVPIISHKDIYSPKSLTMEIIEYKTQHLKTTRSKHEPKKT